MRAVAWAPAEGYLYERSEIPVHLEVGDVVLVVSDDGLIRGVRPLDHAPLTALLRVEGDLAEVVQRLEELADRTEGFDTGLAVEVSSLKGRVRRLEARTPGL